MQLDQYVDSKYYEMAVDWLVSFLPKVLLAIAILIIGLWVAKRFSKVIRYSLSKSNMGQEVEDFLGSIVDLLLKLAVILAAVATVGVEVSAIFGVLAAASFAVGLALQGFLGNFASGLTIIFFKPYRVGDWVVLADTFGKVQKIEIFSSELLTPGEKTVTIPNGQITDNIITNYSTRGRIRLELTVSMPYSESYEKVQSLIRSAVTSVDNVMTDPAPLIGIDTYDSHNIQVSVRPCTHPDNFWQVSYDCYAAIKKAYSEAGIAMAYSEGVELGKIGD
jgi:small conductance mechanosensitive channel